MRRPYSTTSGIHSLRTTDGDPVSGGEFRSFRGVNSTRRFAVPEVRVVDGTAQFVTGDELLEHHLERERPGHRVGAYGLLRAVDLRPFLTDELPVEVTERRPSTARNVSDVQRSRTSSSFSGAYVAGEGTPAERASANVFTLLSRTSVTSASIVATMSPASSRISLLRAMGPNAESAAGTSRGVRVAAGGLQQNLDEPRFIVVRVRGARNVPHIGTSWRCPGCRSSRRRRERRSGRGPEQRRAHVSTPKPRLWWSSLLGPPRGARQRRRIGRKRSRCTGRPCGNRRFRARVLR